MSFVANGSAMRISLFDLLTFLSPRKKKILDRWATPFSDHIFKNIDEMIFAPLYSEKTNSRPNAPVNVIVGALILKELTGMTDDEIMDACEMDFRFQYALHITSFDDSPISDRTFSRFRERVAAYEYTTGEDLIHTCISSLSEHIREYMGINPSVKRMDSMMIESNIRKLSRLELLYTCVANVVTEAKRHASRSVIKEFLDYTKPDNRNKVVYHNNDVPVSERIQKIIEDAMKLLPLCKEELKETADYQLLERAIEEQTKEDGNGGRTLKTKDDGMSGSIMQNPSDPDATFRSKAGKEHRGYSANIIEAVDENGSVITEYQYDVNTRSDASFIKEYIENENELEHETIITDGAYSGDEIKAMAKEKNKEVLTTNMTGKKPKEILADFEYNEQTKEIVSCAAGHKPEASKFYESTGTIRVTFASEQCINCPHKCSCSPKIGKRVAFLMISIKALKRLKSPDIMTEEQKIHIARIRNGIETVPSVMRRKHNVDKMPLRGKVKTKHLFGFKVGAFNFTKMLRFINGKEKCRAFDPIYQG